VSSDERLSVGRGVARASAVMAAGTVASRASGFVRAALIAAVLGTGAVADVFTVPNTIPNALYMLVAGGVLNAVLVPQLVRAIKADPDGGAAYAQRLVTAASAVLLVATVLAVALAPWLVRLYVSDALLRPENQAVYDSMVAIARFTLPQIFFYGYYVLLGQILTAHGRFGPMMFAPILNNVIAVLVFGSYFVVVGTKSDPVFTTAEAAWFGLGSTLGIAAQALVLVPLVLRSGVSLRPRRDLRGVGLGKAARLAGWTVAFVGLNQVATLVVVRLSTIGTASSLEADTSAGLAAYQNAFLLAMAPHSVLTVSIATALLPTMAARAAAGDLRAVGAELSAAMRTCTSIIAPVTGLLWVSSYLVTAVLFGFGAAAGQTGEIGDVLLVMAPGLLGFTLHYLAMRGFYALEDTRTPFFVQLSVAGTNIVAALLFTQAAVANDRADLVAVALAAAWTLSYLVGCLVALAVLHRRLPEVSVLAQVRAMLHAVAAATPGTLLALGLLVAARAVFPDTRGPAAALVLVLLLTVVAGFVFLLTARLLHLREPAALIRLLVGRRRGTTPGGRPGSAPPGGTTGGEGPPPGGPAAPGADTEPQPVPARAEPGRAQAAGPSADPIADPIATTHLTTGPDGTRRLRGRHRLQDLLAAAPYGLTSWYATDEVLGRPVLVQTLPADHPRAEAFVAAARRAALARDPRLLRVLDADIEPPAAGSPVAYVVREWVDGRSLTDLLQAGPLPPVEAAALTREVAAALAEAHTDGLVHGWLTPDHVLVVQDGAVRLTGLETELALQGPLTAGGAPDVAAGVVADTRGAGGVLYAGLTGRWPREPGGDGPVAEGLPEAPTWDGRPVLPHQVRAGVPRALDDIVARALDHGRRHRGDAFATTRELAEALGRLLPEASAGAPLAGTRLHAAVAPVVTARAAPTPPPAAPAGDPGAPPRTSGRARRTLATVVGLVLLAGALLLALQVLLGDLGGPAPPAAPPSTGASAVAREIQAADDFDPLGDGSENPSRAPGAVDGDPGTSWRTSTYFTPLADQKAGVGLVLDLGEPVLVRELTLQLRGEPTTLEVRTAPADATSPPSGAGNWAVSAQLSGVGEQVEVTLDDPATTRFVLLWFTELPAVEGGWRAEVREVEVRG
jgi:putative peptidoglycan lipid II flippase